LGKMAYGIERYHTAQGNSSEKKGCDNFQ